MKSGFLLVNIFVAATLSQGLVLPTIAAPTSQAKTAPSAVSSTWTGGSLTHAADSDHRQLAYITAVDKTGKSGNHGRHVIQIEIPENVETVGKIALLKAQEASRFTAVKAVELYRWVELSFKQFNGAPVMTPLGGPYAYQDGPNGCAKLWFTSDRRLKTVVSR